ncbi:ACR3 family arsenite transporter [Natranaerovirga pectinivora]|uniref:ACR3 family arsenite transporter n=1 Tax=Natranaerovirga pectinivora TaxID=682400 RepID=A0A4R3MF41_9FIRM|nr:ACR3 family arsenite efflux transporter [Natranaerovirga pectinivora]TCT12111.1 ACR3 family arsenite transporter [Natranaerovirga pectinivora]
MEKEQKQGIGFFEKYLTIWVAICIVAGVAIGRFLPIVPETLERLEVAKISIPIAILIWLMIYPMMLKIDFSSIVEASKKPKGLAVTTVVNWLIKPFTMYLIAAFFFQFVFKNWFSPELAENYLAGAVLLGAAPCTAMVFVWSHLTKGDGAYTLVQVAVNNLILLVAFTPIVAFLLGVSNVPIPYDTLFLSVAFFIIIPLLGGYLSRKFIIKAKGEEYFEEVFVKKFNGVTITGLLLTLTLIFTFQGDAIINNPVHIVLIAIPLIIQTFLIFFLAYGWAKAWKLPHNVAGPAALIGSSNFFELAVAVAITLFGAQSGAALVTVVGVLVEVPLMLTLVKIVNKTKKAFD